MPHKQHPIFVMELSQAAIFAEHLQKLRDKEQHCLLCIIHKLKQPIRRHCAMFSFLHRML